MQVIVQLVAAMVRVVEMAVRCCDGEGAGRRCSWGGGECWRWWRWLCGVGGGVGSGGGAAAAAMVLVTVAAVADALLF